MELKYANPRTEAEVQMIIFLNRPVGRNGKLRNARVLLVRHGFLRHVGIRRYVHTEKGYRMYTLLNSILDLADVNPTT